jgi:DegV family protein with EDD domain
LPPAFGVVTDSTADLPPEWGRRYGIEVVPLTVNFGTESYRDGVDLDGHRFYSMLASARRLPTTAAPSPGDFATVYGRLSKRCGACISIHLAGSLSATVESARLGAQSVEGFRVEVVDSGSLSMAMAFLCRLAGEQASLDEAVSAVTARVPRLRILALLDTLRYVEMGGRVTRAQAMIGNMLDLKPVLGMAAGEIKGLDRVRTRGRAIPRLVELLRAEIPLENVAVMHAQAAAEAERLQIQLQAEMPDLKVELGELGAVLGTHTGPGALGLAFVKGS